jgi:hypothetical protein
VGREKSSATHFQGRLLSIEWESEVGISLRTKNKFPIFVFKNNFYIF